VNGKVYVIGGRSKAADVGVLEMKHPEIEVYTPTR
jgi:hypothetical protein